MRIKAYSCMLVAAFMLSGITVAMAYDQPMSNTGTPQTGQYTPGGRTPQAQSGVGGSAPSGKVDSNTGSEDYYYDEKTYTWKHKNQ